MRGRRSSRRKSAWNLLLLLIFPMWCFLWGVAISTGYALHLVLHAEPMARWAQWPHVLDKPMAGAEALLILAPMIPTLTGAMVICNFLVWQIPAARRAMKAESQNHAGTSYGIAQRALGQITLYTAPFAVSSDLRWSVVADVEEAAASGAVKGINDPGREVRGEKPARKAGDARASPLGGPKTTGSRIYAWLPSLERCRSASRRISSRLSASRATETVG